MEKVAGDVHAKWGKFISVKSIVLAQCILDEKEKRGEGGKVLPFTRLELRKNIISPLARALASETK